MYGALIPVYLSNPAPYLEHDAEQIAHLLGLLFSSGQTVCLYPNQQKEPFAISTLLACQRDALILDAPQDGWLRSLLSSTALCCVAQVRGVLLQFAAEQVELIDYDGAAAFRVPWPSTLLRLQRRQAYRATVPMQLKALCTLESGATLEVADLSAGGIGLISHQPIAELHAGSPLGRCLLEIGNYGRFHIGLTLRSIQPDTLKSGAAVLRLGCGFLDDEPQEVLRLGRLAVELERKQLELR